tara:strand:+ start:8430 stop:10364 length:1935 start_codon:yes stop_codon:yes gene_type:complete
MALTYAIEGKGVIANCDAITNDTGGTGTGDWTEQGGGTMSISNDVFLFNGASIGGKYASKSGVQQFDLGAGNELDFTAGSGTEDGQMLYIWISMTALGTLDTLANFGLCIRFSSDSPSTTNYIDYLIAGNDDKNGWTGGFKCFVVDPTLTPSRLSGTQSSIIASVRCIGVWIDTSTSARADSIFIDQMAVGSGIRVTGTSTTAISDMVTYCTDYTVNRAWGMWQEREGIFFSYGKTIIGDAASQTAAVSFEDTGAVVQFGLSEYYETGAWKSSMGTAAHGIVIEDHASWTTTFTDGVAVGTDGRSGSLFRGNTQQDVSMDLYGGSNAASVTALYSTAIKDCTGVLNSGDDAQHLFYGATFEGCAQFDPVGAPVLRNCNFISTVSTTGALLWNDSIDIQICNFLANTLGEGTEHTSTTGDAVGTVTTFDGLGVVLHDTAASFLTTAAVNDIVFNETDGSDAKVLSVDSNIQLTTDSLTGGTDDQFGVSDAYSVVTPITYTDLVFTNNTSDITNAKAGSNGLAITKSGTSNPITSTGVNVDIRGSVAITITVKDVDGALISGAVINVQQTSDDTVLVNDTTAADGQPTTDPSFTGSTPQEVKIYIRKGSSADSPKYKSYSSIQTITTSGLTLDVTLVIDPNNNSTT